MTEDKFGIVGKVIARTYEVREVVAEGGFGVVYRAYHQGFRAEVALKCLKIPRELSAEQRASFLEQFRSEAEVLFRLSSHSAHIVRPLHVDAFHTSDELLVPFIALEWLEGRTLDALMISRAESGRPALSLKEVVGLLTPVAVALEMAHNLPGKEGPEIIVHRDMKPENLFIARVRGEDFAKILDFGISKVKSTASQMVGRASAQADALVSFSPAYGAPEQWAPRRYGQTGRWTDVWGLALSIVEVISGKELITGDHAEMMGTILDPGRRPSPRTEGIQVGDGVETVFLRALAVDPRKRYQTIGAFWDALTLALNLQQELGGCISASHVEEQRRHLTDLDSIAPSSSFAFRASDRTPIVAAGLPEHREALSEHDQASSSRKPLGVELAAIPDPKLALVVEPNFGSGMKAVVSSPRPFRPAISYAPSNHASLLKALGPALSFVALSVAFTVLDRAVAYSHGSPLEFGPIRASWIAGLLMVVAILTAVGAIRRHWEE